MGITTRYRDASRFRRALKSRAKRKTTVTTTRVTKRARPYAKRRTNAKRNIRPRHILYNRLLSNKVLTTLHYCDTKTIDPGTSMDSHLFALNNINDPDFSGAGHRPGFHVQWAALYGNYRVISCAWNVTLAPFRRPVQGGLVDGDAVSRVRPDSTHHDMQLNPVILFTEVSDTSTMHFTESGDLNFLRETGKTQDRVKYRMTTGDPYKTYSFSGRVAMKDLHIDPDSADESTTMGNNPTDPAYIAIGAMTKDGGLCSDYRMDVRLRYYVELSDPIDVNTS
ncbi:putative capsid protein [uncultured virus]|uniref:Putative capsid protein n=1 Tax=uncultured virus TaxID=340016 RepID=A0A1I9XGD6_9VIRU|nr:putative capsid protein [uncultured virus]